MAREEFSLDALIESVRADVGPDPSDIAAKVQPLIPEAFRSDVELKLLANYVRTMKPRLTSLMSRPAASSIARPNTDPRPAANRSAKVAGFQHLARALAVQVCVGAKSYKTLGECGYDDLMYAATNRRSHAAETIAAAEEYEAWAALLRKHRKTTVAAIPKSVLADFVAERRAAA